MSKRGFKLDYFDNWTPDQPPLNPHQYNRRELDKKLSGSMILFPEGLIHKGKSLNFIYTTQIT